ncbi:hypothetical protein [Pseudomonas sp. TE3610]
MVIELSDNSIVSGTLVTMLFSLGVLIGAAQSRASARAGTPPSTSVVGFHQLAAMAGQLTASSRESIAFAVPDGSFLDTALFHARNQS